MEREITVKNKDRLMTSTDLKGNITFGNEAFEKISGYSKDLYIGKPHNIIRHQDMPKVIFKLMWEAIQKGKDFNAIIKNMTIDGNYYWVATHFDVIKDEKGNVIGYEAMRFNVPKAAKREMTELYRVLRDIEKREGMEASQKYIEEFLRIKGQTFNEYMYELIQNKSFWENIKK